MEELENEIENELSTLEFWNKDFDWNKFVYDSFTYNYKKILVIKNENIGEFLGKNSYPNLPPIPNKKKYFLAQVLPDEGVDIIVFLKEQEYFQALDHYLELKNIFLEEGESNE